jgi:hypothetical protein
MIYKSDWVDLIGTNSYKIAISSKGVRSANITVSSCLYLSVKVVIVFGSNLDNNCLVNLYPVDRSSSDVDSIPLWQQRIKQFSNSEKVITISNLNTITLDTIKVEVKNNNTASTVYAWISYKTAYMK